MPELSGGTRVQRPRRWPPIFPIHWPPSAPHDRRSHHATIGHGPLAISAVTLRHIPAPSPPMPANMLGSDPAEKSFPHRSARRAPLPNLAPLTSVAASPPWLLRVAPLALLPSSSRIARLAVPLLLAIIHQY